MESLNILLPILLYITAIILLIILIILGIKLIYFLNRVEKIIDNVETKVKSFDNLFSVFAKTANSFATITDSVVFWITSAVSKIFNKKKEEENFYE